MTRALSVTYALALTIECDYCGAVPDQWCVTARGRHVGTRTAWLHTDRTWRFHTAQHAGAAQGQVWALSGIESDLDPGNKWGPFARGELRTWSDIRAHVAGRLDVHRRWAESARQRVADATGYDDITS